MTNDTTTIAGALQEVIDRLETNLDLRGVDDPTFDPSTGILGQVDRIMEIEPSTNIDLNITCTLTSSENNIAYGESILLTALLQASYNDQSGGPELKTGEITGATIQFKKGNTLIGTSVTDNNGVATLTYTPTTSPETLNLTATFPGTVNFQRAVSSTVNVTVTDYLELESDKDILSAADNEYATLTATLHSSDKTDKNILFEVRKQNSSGNNTFILNEDHQIIFDDNTITLDTDTIELDFSNIGTYAEIIFELPDTTLIISHYSRLSILEFNESEQITYIQKELNNIDNITIDLENNELIYSGGTDSLQGSYDTITSFHCGSNDEVPIISEDSLIELLTSTTNNQGIANVYYYGKSEGDLYIKAKKGIIFTQTYELCDAIKYYDITFTSSQTLSVPNIPSNFKAIFTVHRNAHNNANMAWLEIGSNSNNCLIFGLTSSGYNGELGDIGVFAKVNGSYADSNHVACIPDDSDWDMEYTYDDGVQTITDGTNTSTITNSQITSRTYVKVNVNRSTLKNIIIMPL